MDNFVVRNEVIFSLPETSLRKYLDALINSEYNKEEEILVYHTDQDVSDLTKKFTFPKRKEKTVCPILKPIEDNIYEVIVPYKEKLQYAKIPTEFLELAQELDDMKLFLFLIDLFIHTDDNKKYSYFHTTKKKTLEYLDLLVDKGLINYTAFERDFAFFVTIDPTPESIAVKHFYEILRVLDKLPCKVEYTNLNNFKYVPYSLSPSEEGVVILKEPIKYVAGPLW